MWVFLTVVATYALCLLMCQYNKINKKVGYSPNNTHIVSPA